MTSVLSRCMACRRVAVLGCFLAVAGCGSEPSGPSKQQTSSAVPRIATPPKRSETVAEPEPEPEQPPPPPPTKKPVGPWLQWQLAGGTLVEGKSYLNLIAAGNSGALQLASYDLPDHEDFPSLFIRAITPAKTIAELVGKKLPAQLYIAADKDGTIIHNLATQPVEIVITEIDGKNIRGSFAGHAHDVDSGGNGPISGNFQAIIE